MSLPTVPRDLVPLAPASLSLTLQYELPEPGEYDGQPVTSVLWSVEARSARPRCSLFGPPSWDLRANMVAHGVDPVPAWVPRPPASWLALVAEMAGAVGLDSDEPLPVVAEAIAQAKADHHIAELARTWHALHLQYRAETEGPEGHLKAATWARLNRALVALAAALDAEVES